MRSLWLVLTLLAATPALAAPASEPWPRWERSAPGATAQVDQAPWAGLLRRYLRPGADGINRFAYAAVTPADKAALEADVARLAGVPVSALSRAEQRAFWTNLYNELTVLVVLRAMPVASIMDIGISPGLFTRGPWDAKLVEVEGERLSLNDIEHRILRPIWRDPRTHYAVNCASLGCPNLAPEPYTAAGMEAQLDRAARAYVNHPRGFQVRDGRLTVSSIYTWYKADFGGTDAGVVAHLRRYAEPTKAATLDGVSRIGADAYDWSLNGAGP
jgi:hypothetical protein